MKSIARLKEQARLHEQREEWDKAIEAYEQIIRRGDESGEEVELHLFNRVGDLYLRLGRQKEAVACYEEAADRYGEAGFYNNAIALCNKALRYAPDRAELYRKLGQFSGAQGFLTDARRYFLEYAERKQRRGEIQEAFRALEEFADLSDDAEIRELLAKQLEAHGAREDAVTQLRKAYELRMAAGETAAASALEARIRALDPGAELPDVPAGDAGEAGGAQGGSTLPGLVLQSAAGAAGLDLGGDGPDAGRAGAGAAPIGDLGLVPTRLDTPEPDRDDVEGLLELPTLDDAVDAPDPMPLLDASSPGGPGDAAEQELPMALDLGDLNLAQEATGDSAVPEPADVEAEDAEYPFEVRGLDAADDGAEVDFALDEAQKCVAAGRFAEAVERLDALRDRLESGGRLARALTLVADLAARVPDNMPVHQLRVEYATRLGDHARLIEAYLGLGECLGRAGAKTKAAAVFERVLEMDPDNARARRGLSGQNGQPAAPPDGGDYVDLASLVASELEALNAEPAPALAAAADDGDFMALLSQFRAKATEHVGADDPGSHYDLGLAFKEMGLVDEAIGEFQKALSGGEEQLKVYEELGQCFMLKEQYDLAVKILARALQIPRTDDRELLGVYYHLGRCYEELGQSAEARSAFERVAALGGNFQDVTERLARL